MTAELTILAWTLVFAIVQILFPAVLRTQETGVDYNASARDTPSPAPVGKLTGRLQRAQSNLFETLPLFAAAVLIAHVAGRNGDLTFWGASLYLAGRLAYLPLYAAGIPVIRSLAWTVSLGGLVMILIAILRHT
jgi:uncharacterized MAPEG superfamily protein